MRVCLTNPTWRNSEAKGIRAGCRVPNTIGAGEHTFMPFPFTLAYATARLEAEGIAAEIIDAIGEDLDRETYLGRVVDRRPDVIVNEMSTQSHYLDLAVAEELKKRTHAVIVVCGSHPTAIAEEILQHEFIDVVLLGEYEQSLVEVVAALDDGRPLEDIEGVACRKANREVHVGSKRTLLENLDDLPYPHRDTLPLNRYRVAGFPEPVLFMYASRGCPYQCTFCVWPQWFQSGSYRARDPRKVAEEIEHAQQKWGPFGSIYFDDDTFNIGKPRMMALADELETRGLCLPWGCNARPDLFDEEMLERLARVGLFNIRIGIESGDEEVLRRTKKNLDLDSVGRCIDMAHRAGVKVHVTFTIGLSGESWNSVKRTVAFAKSIRPDSCAFTVTTPFPGTEYYDEVVREGLLTTRKWDEFNVVSNCVIRTETMSPEEILRAEKYVMRQMYYSPHYMIRRLRYAASGAELGALAKKGVRFVLGRF